MKKLIGLFIVLLLILSGCLEIIQEEDSDEYRALSAQYDDFITHDVLKDEQFESFINSATFESILSNVMIKTQFFNDLNSLVETRYGSGVIVSKGVYYYVLTTSSLINSDQYHNATYQVTDYQGRITRAYVDHDSTSYGLTVLRFQRTLDTHLPAIEFADQMPLNGEPILEFGYKGKVMNSMTMGLMVDRYVDEATSYQYFYTTIASDAYANGSAIINLNNQLIGIQVDVVDGMSYAISIQEIIEFLQFYES